VGRPAVGEPAGQALSPDTRPPRGPATSTVLAAQEGCDGQPDGCTGLHWLDDTIFRECCDTHDRCFEEDYRSGDCCEAWSWFFPLPWWQCARCNFSVVRCFVTRTLEQEGQWSPSCAPTDLCERCSPSDWCDIECQSCRTRSADKER
jgi:hypothetical protein